MRSFIKLIGVQGKLFVREPPAFFFTLVFPTLLLVIFGAVFGNEPDPQFNPNFGFIDSEVPGLSAIVIATVALLGIPIETATNREYKVLRRFRASPLSPLKYLTATVFVYFCMALLGMLVMVVAAKALFHLRFAGTIPSVLGAFMLSAAGFFGVGYLIASVAPTARIAQTVGQILFFPMMFLSGATLPLEIMPSGVRGVSELLPLTHAVKLMQGVWFGESWTEYFAEIGVLVLMLLIGVALSVRWFRWE